MHLYRKIRKSFWAPDKILYPDKEFLAIKAACENVVRLIEKDQPILLNLIQLKECDEVFGPLNRKVENYEWTHSEYGNFGLFIYYFQEFGALAENIEELNQFCAVALSHWCDFEMLVTENLQEWIIENHDLYERTNIAFMYISFTEFSSEMIINMSHMDIHIPTEEIQPMIQFSRLYAEQYAYLLREFPDYDLQTYIDQMYPF